LLLLLLLLGHKGATEEQLLPIGQHHKCLLLLSGLASDRGLWRLCLHCLHLLLLGQLL
jgi:hypothetical protein